MRFFERVTNNLRAVGNNLSWVGDYLPINTAISASSYALNTGFLVLEQVVTLKTAIPNLVTKTNSRKVADAMFYLALWDVGTMTAVHFVNNYLQQASRDAREPESDWDAVYMGFLYGMILADFGVQLYTIRESAQSFTRITVLDAVAPPIFHADSKRKPHTICTKEQCNFQRKVQGTLREPILLLANDALVGLISKSPLYGTEMAIVLRVFFNGRYITRLATPDLCERHKYQLMRSDSVLALGIVYEGTSQLMEYALKNTIGVPPYLFYRTLKHLLLLLHGNVAAHMNLPVASENNALVKMDPFNNYEGFCRFSADVIMAGLVQRVPVDFRPEAGTPSLTLGEGFKYAADILNAEVNPGQTILSKRRLQFQQIIPWVLPKEFRSTDDFINDPINAAFWEIVHKSTKASIEVIKKYGLRTTTQVAAVTIFRKKVARIINYLTGVPAPLALVLLSLCPEQDFWEFIYALENWLNRHQVIGEVTLALPPATTDGIGLHGNQQSVPVPDATSLPTTLPAEVIINHAGHKNGLAASDIIPVNNNNNNDRVTLNPSTLFAKRNRRLEAENDSSQLTSNYTQSNQ